MSRYLEISGNLITLAKEGKFDVIAHGCNCFCRMKRGIAPQMAEAFGCDNFTLEDRRFYEGYINKLGTIDAVGLIRGERGVQYLDLESFVKGDLIVVNAYTQYNWDTKTKPFDYEAFTMCMRKMNHMFKGLHIGLPQIGAHLAGGDWSRIEPIIKQELKDCNVTVVIWDGK